MMNTQKIFFSLATLLILVLSSCSDFNQIVKGDDYEKKLLKAEALYEEAIDKRKVKEGVLLEKGLAQYGRAITLYEQVYQRFPREEKGELSYYRMAQCYFAVGDYYLAGYYYNNFVARFPFSTRAEECMFMTAMCSVKLSPEESLDQEETEVAINDFQLFVDRYPESKLVDSCNKYMDKLRYKIETKEYNSVMLYSKMERYKAADASATTFLEIYPQSKFAEEMQYVRIKNLYTLATKSIFSKQKERFEKVLEYYTIFVNKYENSDYLKRIQNYYEKAGEQLLLVDEKQAYFELLKAYDKAQLNSKAKKIIYLEDTLERYRNFVTQFPNSEYLKKVKDLGQKAEKELVKLQDKV
ncbi:MAG: outer membrane protein assembly factor BamD [Lishizhenia sp.]